MRPLLIALTLSLWPAAGWAAGMLAAAPHGVAIDYRFRQLPNGLKVYSAVDRHTANVAVQIWYGVGAKNDPPGRSGLAHLVEHLMFKGSSKLPPEFIDRLTNDVGGENNASTDQDFTKYEDVAPSAHLERLLWAEAERMGSLTVDHAGFVAERGVVEQELREAIAADPYSTLMEFEVPAASFALSTNRRSVGGSIGDLERIGRDEAKSFHSRYYRPDNATLIVVGNFDQDQLDRWVTQYFGVLVRPVTPLPRAPMPEPKRLVRRQTNIYAPGLPQPAVIFTYAAPGASSVDATRLKALEAILTIGANSRLDRSLVVRRRVADDLLSDVDLRQQNGLVGFGLILADGAGVATGKAALRREIARLRRAQVTPAELKRAKNLLLVDLLQNRETIDGTADALGEAAVVRGNAAWVNRDVAEIEKMTARDLQRTARDYLIDGRSVTIIYQASHSRSAIASKDAPVPRAPPSASILPPADPGTNALADERLPPLSIPPPLPLASSLSERFLQNGLRVIVGRTGPRQLVTAALLIRSGSALDPVAKTGLAELTASMAAEGARRRVSNVAGSAADLLREALLSDTDYSSTVFALTSLAPGLADDLAFLAAIGRSAKFQPSELRSARARLADDATGPGDADSIGQLAIARLLFGDSAYGKAGGSYQSLARISLADISGARARLYRPDNAILVIAGDVSPAASFRLAEQAFGGWVRPSGRPPRLATPGPVSIGSQVLAIDLPEAEQATVMLASRTVGRMDPSFAAVDVANAFLGGARSSLLNTEIRTKRGWTYDASSEVRNFLGSGLFTATTKVQNAHTAEAAALMVEQLEVLGRRPPAMEELGAREAELSGQFSRTMETSEGMAYLLADTALNDIDLGELARYPSRLAAITPEQVRLAAGQLANPSKTDVIVIGDSRQFLTALKEKFPKVGSVSAAALSVNALTFSRAPQQSSARVRRLAVRRRHRADGLTGPFAD